MAEQQGSLGYDPKKFMKNSSGFLVPMENVPEKDKLKDDVVRAGIESAVDMSKRLRRLKATVISDILTYQDTVKEQYGAKVGGDQGNLSLVSFDGSLRVQLTVNKNLHIDDENLQAAKALIDECLVEWSEESRPELGQVINSAFKVDGQGRVNTKSILALMKLKIKDERWERAMDALSEGLRVDGKKTYLRFHKRAGDDNHWEAISLNLAAV